MRYTYLSDSGTKVLALSDDYLSNCGTSIFKGKVIESLIQNKGFESDSFMANSFKLLDRFTFFQNSKRHYGYLFRKESFWIGLHYSKECKIYCLNLIPCLTIWWTKKGGLPVNLKRM